MSDSIPTAWALASGHQGCTRKGRNVLRGVNLTCFRRIKCRSGKHGCIVGIKACMLAHVQVCIHPAKSKATSCLGIVISIRCSLCPSTQTEILPRAAQCPFELGSEVVQPLQLTITLNSMVVCTHPRRLCI